MKVYVYLLPKFCLECQLDCPYEDRCVDTITMNCSECIGRPKDCPLHSLTDYTKQVRKEVCEKIKKEFQKHLIDWYEDEKNINSDLYLDADWVWEVLDNILKEYQK